MRVIVQAEEDALTSLRFRLGRGLRRQLAGALSLDLNASDLSRLVADGNVAHLSGDLPVVADMAITNKVTRADQVWAGSRGLLGLLSQPAVTGSGIGVAVIDSGIADHTALAGRVVARVNLVSHEPNVSGDPFGHGTHIAGIIGGSAAAASRVTPAYAGGSAPGVHFVDVRVLGSERLRLHERCHRRHRLGHRQRTRHGIRVINLSLGHPVTEPSATDPLCRAVARAVQAGIVVGRVGRQLRPDAPDGAPVLGGITSPGNSPLALTVGALDTWDTVDRADDTRRALQLARPDDVRLRGQARRRRARGRASSRSRIAELVAERALSAAGTSPAAARNAYYRLSGTSMSAAVVSGGVALLLDGAARSDTRAGEDRAPDRRPVPARRRTHRRRRRQRRLRGVAAARRRAASWDRRSPA